MGLFRRMFGLLEVEPDGAKGLSINRDSGVSDVVSGWPNWPLFDSYGVMYRRQPAVRTVVDFLARNIAQLNPKVYMRAANTDRVEWNDHPVAELLRHPNPSTTRYSHLRDTVADIAIYDRAYWRLERSRGMVRALVRIPPSRLAVEWDETRLRTIYRLNGVEVPRSSLVIFHGYHPDGSEQGVSPLETLRRVLSEEWASQTHREWFWRNAARQSGIIQRPLEAPPWSEETARRFRSQWEAAMTGGVNSGRTAILDDGMTWSSAAFSPKDSEYIEGRKLTYEEVARVYAPSLVGLLGAEGQKANVESYHRQLYQDVLAPICRMLQDEIDHQLLSLDEFNFGDMNPAYTEFNLAEKLKGSFEEQQRALTTAVGVPHMSINEGRARLNLPRIDEVWADVPVQPMNVLYGGQPAVNVPVGGGEATASAASVEFPVKLAAFFANQEQSVCSTLGALKNLGADAVEVWRGDRWTRELAGVYQLMLPQVDAEQAAKDFTESQRVAIFEAFRSGGIDAVHDVFATFPKAAAALARPKPLLLSY